MAAFLPPLVGAGAIALTFLGLRLAVEVHSLSVFALNLVTGLGLGLAIDYSLFIVSRWREEAARHGHGPEALAATMRSAGRTVVFSAVTVAASMGCLLVFPQQFLYSMGLGGVLVALAAGLVALVPLPAFLYWLGPRIDALAPRRLQQVPSGGRWGRLASWVMRRPGRIAAVSASLSRPPRPARARRPLRRRRRDDASPSASARQVSEALDRDDVRGSLRADHGDHGRAAPAGGVATPRCRLRASPRSCRRGRSRRPLAARRPPARSRGSPTARSSSSGPSRGAAEARSPARRPDSSTSRRRSARICRGRSRSSRSRPAR